MKIYTYHTYHSSGVGGVETLLRHLKKKCISESQEIIEVYHGVMGSEQYSDSKLATDIQLSGYDKGYNLLGSIWRKCSLFHFFLTHPFESGDVLILSHPMNLNFIPQWVKDKLTIILVQINRADVYLSHSNLKAVKKYHQDINHVTVYTEQDKVEIEKLCFELTGKCVVIPRGCKLATAQARISSSKKLLTIARIEEKQKNFAAMVSIMKALPPEYTLDIYGDGSKEEITELLTKIKDEPRIQYCGVTQDVESVLQQYSLFIMTSRYEGFGQTLIEARSQGLPVVLFNTFDAASWIVEDGVNGYLIPEGDINTFSQRIMLLCEDDEKYQQVSGSAIKSASTTDKQIVDQAWFELLTTGRY
ncbi:putative glycosyl transferase [Aliivibrio wodanis]|uniref:Putative glycosyl transferase n=1 Tax=Aliivibrio wodanis TaxID=80852 RepID=A0A090IJD2_9GAMM|nr:putative glycosyl transferase [Aliivibrio wodanis]